MALFDWNDQYALGVPVMDAQHQRLVDMLNQLHQSMLDAQSKDVLEPLLAGLTRYAVVHFGEEEKLMRAAGYPDYARHKEEHAKLTAEVTKFQQQYQSGKIALTVPLLQFLKTWLKDHILGSDARYAPYLAGAVRR